MLTAELQFTVTFLKSQAILSLCHCDNGMDQILPADIIMEFNWLWHTLMKNVKPFSSPPCAATTHSRCPAWRCPYGRLVLVIFSLMSGEPAVWKGCCGCHLEASVQVHWMRGTLSVSACARSTVPARCWKCQWHWVLFHYPLPIYMHTQNLSIPLQMSDVPLTVCKIFFQLNWEIMYKMQT